MKNPYEILGVSPTATDDEVKQAWRALARKYHPDKYRDSDLADLASEKMKDINAAYEEIQNIRKNGGAQAGAGSNGGYNYNYAGNNSSSSNPKYNNIRRLINTGNVAAAENELMSFHEGDRTAEWNFLYGCVLVKKGQFVDAQRYFDIACSMNPYNNEYRTARENLRRRANGYGGGYTTTTHSGCSTCDICSGLMCADCCCECCGGDLISCC